MYNALTRAMQPQQQAKPAKTQVFVVINGQQAGPFTQTELVQLVKKGLLAPATLVWESGLPNWVAASSLPHINKLLILHTPASKTPAPEPAPKIKKPAPKEQTPHPLRADLIGALGQLGYRGADTANAVDALLAAQPDISSSAALKQLLQQLR